MANSIEAEIIEVATKVIDRKIDLLDACRQLVYLQYKLENPPEEFILLRGICSETDIFPISEVERKQWEPKALSRLDREQKKYISLVETQMLEACRKIINVFSVDSSRQLY